MEIESWVKVYETWLFGGIALHCLNKIIQGLRGFWQGSPRMGAYYVKATARSRPARRSASQGVRLLR